MRTVTWIRLTSAVLVSGLGLGAVASLRADDVPPPYPSVSPVSGTVPQEPSGVAVPAPAPSLPATPVIKPTMPTLPAVAPAVPIVPQVPVTTPVVPTAKPSELPKSVVPTTPPVTPAAKSEASKPSSVSIKMGAAPGLASDVAKLASAITESKLAYERVMDYSCHYVIQSKATASSTDRIYELHARCKPAAAYIKLVEPKAIAGTEICFTAGKSAVPTTRIKPANGTYATVPMADTQAKVGRRTPDQVGIGSILESIDNQIATETRLSNPLGVVVQDFTYAGRAVTRYELTCERSHAYRTAYRTVVFIDKELKLPIRYETYDEPKRGEADMIECISFVNLKTNVGHSSAVFER
jgi:hypothetical protein